MRARWVIAAAAATVGLFRSTAALADTPRDRERADVVTDDDDDGLDFEAEARFWSFDHFGQSIVVGRPLGDHVSVLTGVSVTVLSLEQEADTLGYIQLRIPIELKVSLRRPAPDTIVPTVRASVWFTHHAPLDVFAEPSRGIGSGLFGGATYFFSEHFGAGIEAGLGMERTWAGDDSVWLFGTSWRGHFVLRV